MRSVIQDAGETAHELDPLAGTEHEPHIAYGFDVLRRNVRRNKQSEALELSAEAWASPAATRLCTIDLTQGHAEFCRVLDLRPGMHSLPCGPKRAKGRRLE